MNSKHIYNIVFDSVIDFGRKWWSHQLQMHLKYAYSATDLEEERMLRVFFNERQKLI